MVMQFFTCLGSRPAWIKTKQRVQRLRNLSDDYSSRMSYSWLILAGFIPAVEPNTRNVNVLEVILAD